MARHDQEAKEITGNVVPSPMEGKPRLGSTYTMGVLLLLCFPLLPIVVYNIAFQQRLLPMIYSYFPERLHSCFSTALRTAVAATDLDEPLSPKDLLKACRTHQYATEIISLDPLLIYIDNFTSAQEAEALIKLGSNEFAESIISHSRGNTQRVTGRTSQSAPLPMNDPLVACLLNRARKFMGSMLLPSEPFSIPQLVRYFPSQKFDLHTDFWPEHQITTLGDGKRMYFNRIASFFVFLRDNCTEGYTYFPLVEHSSSTNLDRLYTGKVVRGEMNGEAKGIKFKPMQGNAIFWVNLDKDGKGDGRVVHAGLRVGEGEKIGLNLWPRKYFGYVDGGGEHAEEIAARERWNGKWKD